MNKQITIDAVPTAKLMAELGAARTGFYKAIAQLKIPTFMDGKTSMISQSNANSLRAYYQNKGQIQIEAMRPITLDTLDQPKQTEQIEQTQGQALFGLIQAIAAHLESAQLAPKPQETELFTPQRQLQEACDRNWQLSTLQLAKLLGRSPQSVASCPSITQYGFNMTSTGKGKKRSWSITSDS